MKVLRSLKLDKNHYVTWIVAFLVAASVVLTLNIFAKQGTYSTRSTTGEQANNAQNTEPCSHNTQDTCVMAPSVDLYPAGREDAQNPSLRNQRNDIWKSIGGKIEGISGTKMDVRTSSGRAFTVVFPLAVQDWWNETISPNYNNYKVGLGDTVRIDYVEPSKESGRTINENQIVSSKLAIDPTTPSSEPIRRYPY